jgi:hypothetical protein
MSATRVSDNGNSAIRTTTRHINQLGDMASVWSLSEDGIDSVSDIHDFLIRQNGTAKWYGKMVRQNGTAKRHH